VGLHSFSLGSDSDALSGIRSGRSGTDRKLFIVAHQEDEGKNSQKGGNAL
jgi:hypothetical protein